MQNSAKKIVNNSLAIYLNMFLRIFISFYTTKILLGYLGIEDFGLLSIVTSVVSMLSFMSTTMSSTTQRFLSFSIGSKNITKSKETFVNCLFIHLMVAFIAVALFETIGLYFLNRNLNIPSEKIEIVNVLFHIIVAISILQVISSPFVGLSNSYERMFFISSIETLNSILKLGFLISVVNFNLSSNYKLVSYGIALLVISVLSSFVILFFCFSKFEEAKRLGFFRLVNKKKIKEIVGFSFWNMFSVFIYLFRTQGAAIVLNLFFGVVVNAAYGIANQVSMQLHGLTLGVGSSVKPQLVKSEGEGDRERMLKLTSVTTKFSTYIFCMFSVPFFLEIPLIFKLWLVEVPEFSIVFCRLLIIVLLLHLFTVGLVSGIEAIGKIKEFQLTTGCVKLLVIPFAYIMFKLGFDKYCIVYLEIITEAVVLCYRIYYMKKIADFSQKTYYKFLFVKIMLPLIFSFLIAFYISQIIDLEGVMRIVFVGVVFNFSFLPQIFFFCLDRSEKKVIMSKIDLITGFVRRISV